MEPELPVPDFRSPICRLWALLAFRRMVRYFEFGMSCEECALAFGSFGPVEWIQRLRKVIGSLDRVAEIVSNFRKRYLLQGYRIVGDIHPRKSSRESAHSGFVR